MLLNSKYAKPKHLNVFANIRTHPLWNDDEIHRYIFKTRTRQMAVIQISSKFWRIVALFDKIFVFFWLLFHTLEKFLKTYPKFFILLNIIKLVSWIILHLIIFLDKNWSLKATLSAIIRSPFFLSDNLSYLNSNTFLYF